MRKKILCVSLLLFFTLTISKTQASVINSDLCRKKVTFLAIKILAKLKNISPEDIKIASDLKISADDYYQGKSFHFINLKHDNDSSFQYYLMRVKSFYDPYELGYCRVSYEENKYIRPLRSLN